MIHLPQTIKENVTFNNKEFIHQEINDHFAIIALESETDFLYEIKSELSCIFFRLLVDKKWDQLEYSVESILNEYEVTEKEVIQYISVFLKELKDYGIIK